MLSNNPSYLGRAVFLCGAGFVLAAPLAASIACSSENGAGSKRLGLESGSIPPAPLVFEPAAAEPSDPEEGTSELAPEGSWSSEDFADLVDYPRSVSVYCGDGAYDPEVEECDDGVSLTFDVCSNDCQTRDVLVEPAMEAGRLLARRLGTAPHVSSGWDWGGAVTWVDTSAEPQLIVQARDVYGNRVDEWIVAASAASGSSVRRTTTRSNPAVATLPNGMHVVAFNELNGDGSELGVGLSVLRANDAVQDFEVEDAGFANTITQGAQADADLVWTGRTLVAAWVDTSGAESGPDVVFREYEANLSANGVEQPLQESELPEGSVALCPARSSSNEQGWAAVWRRGLVDGAEAIAVRMGDETISFRPTLSGAAVPGFVGEAAEPEPGEGLMPGHAEDRPAIVSLSRDVVLVTFTVGTDPHDSGVATVFRLWAAVVDFDEDEIAWIGPIVPLREGAPDAMHSQRQPALAGASFPTRPGTTASAYLAWRSEGELGGAAGEEVWLKRLDWDATEQELNVSIQEVELPRTAEHQAGDQRRPSLATIQVPGGHALSMAWEDWGRSFDEEELEQAHPDVVVQVAPLPLRRDHDKIKDCANVPCGLGEGPCEKSEDCQGGLICATARGPWHGYGPTTAVCEPAHCSNEEIDGGEDAEDCGGDCGPCFSCLGATSSLGTAHFCSAVCRCENLEGDCDTNLDCREGLACFADQGRLVGYPKGIDLCLYGDCQNEELDSGEERIDCGGAQCVACEPGLPHYCSSETVCDQVGLGGCNVDEDCGVTGDEVQLYCGLNQGIYYGYPEGVGACVPQGCLSARNQLGRVGACSTECPCGNAVGHCAHDAECLSGTCDPSAGARFGFEYGLGACVPVSCVNGSQDAGERGIDCGGACGACPACPGNEPFNSLELPADSLAPGGPVGGWERVGALTSSNNIQWHKSTDASHLDEALALLGQGKFRSAEFSSSTFATVGTELLFDVKFPIVTASGSATLKLWLVEQDGQRHEIATVLSTGEWTTHAAPLNSAERALLNAQTPHLRFEIELLNDAPGYTGVVALLDHFRLEGPRAALRSECDAGQSTDETAEKQLVLGFEDVSLWSSAEVTRQMESGDVQQGETALRVEAISHTLRSVPIMLGAEIGPVVQVDVRLPLASSGALQGSLQVKLACPAASGEVSLGTNNLAHLLAGHWNTLSFIVPSGLWSELEVGSTECEVVLVTNVSNAAAFSHFLYDDLRFTQQAHCSQFAQIPTAPFAVGMPVTPNGTAAYPYPLCNAAQMQTVMDNSALWGAHFRLHADIDLAGVTGNIGSYAQPFSGTFDGQWKTLSNFSQSSSSIGGLFHFVLGDGVLDGQDDGAIRRLVVRDFEVSAGGSAGIVVAQCEGCQLRDIVVDGGHVSGPMNLGGLVGMNTGAVEGVHSSAVVEVIGEGLWNVGGLVGFNFGRVEGSRASGQVMGGSAQTVGGLVGISVGDSQVLSSSATGNVTAAGDQIGGLVGLLGNAATIRHSSAHGYVVQGIEGEAVGGLVGRAEGMDIVEEPVQIEDCHATGRVEGGNGVGGLVGIMAAGRLNDSFALGTVSGVGSRVGGLIGEVSDSIVERSYAGGDVDASTHVGGLIGSTSNSEIADVYARGAVVANDSPAGGLLGLVEDVDLQRAYSLSVVASGALSNVGALVGQDYGNSSDFEDNFYQPGINPELPSLGSIGTAGVAADAQAFVVEATFTAADWNFDSIWEMSEQGPELQRSLCTIYEHRNDPPFLVGVDTPPDGSATNPYVLCNAPQIQWLMNNQTDALLRKNYRLGANIDLTGVNGQIGSYSVYFRGTLDGAGHRLSNYVRLAPTQYQVGLFHTLYKDAVEDGFEDGLIKDLVIEDMEVTGHYEVGALVARNDGRTRNIRGRRLRSVSNAGVTGGVFGRIYYAQVANVEMDDVALDCGQNWCGGLAGRALYSEVANIRFTNTSIVSSKVGGGYMGGLLGELGGTLENVDAEVNVNAPVSNHIGGLVGRVVNTNSRLTDAHVTGTIIGGGGVGGIVASSDGNHLLANSSATVDLRGEHIVGGAIGTISNGGVVDSCSVSGRVVSNTTNYVGGFVGYAQATAAPPNGQVEIVNSESWADVIGLGLQGGFVGGAFNNAHIDHCAAHGRVTSTAGSTETGGFVGRGWAANITHSVATGDVFGGNFSGGFFGGGFSGFQVSNSTASGRVSAVGMAGNIGGFGGAAYTAMSMYACHATGDVFGSGAVGGFLGQTTEAAPVYIENSSASGNVTSGDQNYAGGFVALVRGSSRIVDSQATGNVSSLGNFAGGFAGMGYDVIIEDSRAFGNVTNQGNSKAQVGGFIGGGSRAAFLRDNHASGNVSTAASVGDVGSFVGNLQGGSQTENCIAEGDAFGASYAGGFAGRIYQSYALGCLAKGNATGTIYVGGFAGRLDRSRVSSSEATGDAAGQSQTGAFVGALVDSRLIDVIARGNATTSASYATGGIVAAATNGSVIRRSVSFGIAQSINSYSGGIAGISYDLHIRDSYAIGDVGAVQSTVGGVIGGHYSSLLADSFSYSKVTGANDTKIVAGGTPNPSRPATQFDSVFGHTTINPPSALQTVTGIVGLTTEAFTDQATFEGWDFENVWEMGDSHPVLRKSVCDIHELVDEVPFVLGLEQTPDGSVEAPYILCTVGHVQTVMDSPQLWSENFRLGRSIMLDGVVGQIGNESYPFRGTFDGFGHALFNYRMLGGLNVHYAGLFGMVQGDGNIDGNLDGVIKDLELINAQVTGASYVAALVAGIDNGLIQDVRVDGAKVTASSTNAGLIAAVADGASMVIERVVAEGTLVGKETVGGVVGLLVAGAQLKHAISIGSVQSSATGYPAVGGLVGWIDNASVSSSSATATVSASSGYVGGAVGQMDNASSLLRVKSAGAVTLTSGSHVGGLVGSVNNGTLTDSAASGTVSGPNAGALMGWAAQTSVLRAYASGTVSGSGSKGAFLGDDGGVVNLSNCFATQNNVALSLSGDGSTLTGVTRLSTSDLTTQSVFQSAGWDFTNVWVMGTAGPDLRTVIGFIL